LIQTSIRQLATGIMANRLKVVPVWVQEQV
jgi:hypothetical protein